ncbi:MAG TPA: restriction endonuclease [Myxococcales bacterium]|nr:restriction endonuclease [Myxococcales bacterium]
MTPEEILTRARERELVSEELPVETLSNAIAEENRRRAEAGRRPAFSFTEGGSIEVVEGPAEGAPEERRAGAPRWQQQAAESRRNAAKLLRRRVAELDFGGLERMAGMLLERSGYRDVRPMRRPAAPEGALLIARRKLGVCDYRFAVRIAPSGAEVTREDVQQLRRDMVAQGAHAGLVIGPAEAGREAKAEAQQIGLPLVTLMCADALAEELVLRQIGAQIVEISQVDEGFWKALRRSPPLRAPPAEPEAVPVRPAETAAAEPVLPSAAAPGTAPALEGTDSSTVETAAAEEVPIPESGEAE